MKKRLLCLLLMVTLLVGLMPAAFAEGNIVSYTVKSGDTMLTICEDAGLDYYSCRWCIMKINGFYSESQLGMIYPGQTIKLPASVEVSAKIMSGELNPDGTVPEAKPAETPAPAEDKPADSGSGEANIIKHTIGEWDTLVKVCGSYGMNFYNVKSAIMKINGFTSEKQLDSLRPGQIIKLPASEADAKNVTSSGSASGGTSTGGSTSGGSDVEAKAMIEQPDKSIIIGLSVYMSIKLETQKNATLVPVESIQYEDGKSYIYLYDPDSKTVKKTEVTTGLFDGEHYQILSGCSVGDKIVKIPSEDIEDGQKIYAK